MNKQHDGSLRYNKTLRYHLTNSLAIVTISWPADIAVTVKTLSLELRSCVKVEVDVLGSPSLIVLTISVDVKQH